MTQQVRRMCDDALRLAIADAIYVVGPGRLPGPDLNGREFDQRYNSNVIKVSCRVAMTLVTVAIICISLIVSGGPSDALHQI